MKHLLVLLVSVATIALAVDRLALPKDQAKMLTANHHLITLTIAKTDRERRQGLAERTFLPDDQGLLFVFPDKNYHPFWNLRMRFPIDIIWLDDQAVVDKTTFPADNGQTVSYTPAQPANYVLEIKAGLADQYGLTVGSKISLQR